MLYRIQTEDFGREYILDTIGIYFDGFTIIPATGYYKGLREKSLIVEIITDREFAYRDIMAIAGQIRFHNNQECVLVSRIECRTEQVCVR